MFANIQNISFSNNNSAKVKKITENPNVSNYFNSLRNIKTQKIPFTSLYSKGVTNNVHFYPMNKISFTGTEPIDKILKAYDNPNYNYDNSFLNNHMWHGQGKGIEKRWLFANPADLLKRYVVDSINDIKILNNLNTLPEEINTPTVCGNTWGRRANYIEIIPRVLGEPRKDDKGALIMRDGILNAIKMLPAIPPGSDGHPNCVILCGVLPTIYGDGYAYGHKEDSSLYTMDIDKGFSKDLISEYLEYKGVSAENQIKAFNDLAHLRGLKTGVFMVISEDQIKVNGQQFRWNDENIEKFIQKCCYLVNLGFDSIYFDSAKHIGGTDSSGNYQFYDPEYYQGVGKLPNFWDMQKITYAIRDRTKRPDISIIGENCNLDNRYKEMGFTAGVGHVHPDNVYNEAIVQNHSDSYASGPVVTNDNDIGTTNYEARLERLKEGLFNFGQNNDKLPVLMTMADLWPLNPYTNEHELMMKNKLFTTYGNPENDDLSKHQEYIFADNQAAHDYRKKVNEEFAHFLNY